MIYRKYLILYIIIFISINKGIHAQNTELEWIQKINQTRSDTAKINAYLNLVELNFQNDLQKAYKNIDQVYYLSKKADYSRGLDEYLNLKGKYFFYLEKFDSSIYWYKKYKESDFVENNPERQIITLNNIGLSFSHKNQLDSAYFYLNKGLKIAKSQSDSETICSILNNLGLVVAKQNQFKTAIDYFELAYNCYLNNSKEAPSATLINLATLYTYANDNGQIKKVENLLKQSEKRLTRNELISLYTNLGSNYNHTNEPKLARIYLNRADSINGIYQKKSSPHILHALAQTELLEGNRKNSLALMQKIYSEFPDYSEKTILLNDLAKLNFEDGNYEKSKFFYENLISLKDSIFSAGMKNLALEAQKSTEFYQKEAEINELELDKNKERIIALFVGLGLMFFSFLIWFYYKKEKTKRKLNEFLVESKNKKLQEFYEKIEQRNILISEIETAFSDYKSSLDIQGNLKQDIIDSLDLKGESEIYNHYFEDQHKGFYETLKKLAPDLTNNELRLCSLTKMRMSLKETATVLNLSIDAVKSGRYRLKKKLNIGNEENLTDFLNNLKH